MIRRFVRGLSPHRLKSAGTLVLDFCFPRRCAGCGLKWVTSAEGCWCEDCLKGLAWIAPPLCPCCGLPFLDSPASPDHLCGDCLQGSFAFDSARSAVLYSGVVRDRIHQLKFGHRLYWVPALAQLMEAVFRGDNALPPADLAVPVPLHTKRLRQRGFNQSALLAGRLGRSTGGRVRYDILARRRWTAPQTRLARQERLQNVRNAFEVRRPDLVEGRVVLLVDDVFTTGSTLNECVRTLKSAGAAAVHALTVARALPGRKLATVESRL